MIKKIKILFFILLALWINNIYANNVPKIVCEGLPWCNETSTSWNETFKFISSLISNAIDYVAVFSVISIIVAWIFYIVSIGEEEKAKKAKNWILWSLVWVVISVSAWSIINLLNLFSIN